MSEAKLKLFVSEDDEMLDENSLENDQDFCETMLVAAAHKSFDIAEEDDDPVTHSIPIFHGNVPSRKSQTLHTFQFPCRPHNCTLAGERVHVQIKPNSKVIELKVPMDTLRFYDLSRTKEWGARVDMVSLQGVLDPTNENLYAGAIVEQDGRQRIVLYPLDHTAQLRPLFKYIDDVEAARSVQLKNENAAATGVPKLNAVQVLQTASKSAQGSSNGPLAHGEGLCLNHIRQFNDELWEAFSWHDTESACALREQMKAVKEDPVKVRSLFTALMEELVKPSIAGVEKED